MHAYLLISQNSNFKTQIDKLARKLHTKIMEFPLAKIDDVRSLNNLIRLSFNEPTLIVCQNIHEAGEEALNALLKNLEEPQENIYFALTAPSTRKVLPTIVSRCEVIRTINNLQLTINNDGAEEFTKLTTGEKLAYIDKIKDRGKAIEFAESLVDPKTAKKLETVGQTRSALRANGNVSLQLTNLVINLV
jgi:DNA polymerase III delta prime subunit